VGARVALLAAGLAALIAAGCGGGERGSAAPKVQGAAMTLTSSAFKDGAPVPRRFTCDGDGVSPPLAWSNPPSGTRELVLVVEDPDAPGGTFVHWTLFGIPAQTTAIHEGAVPKGAAQGENSAGDDAWTGPCPPKGADAHRYDFVLYALRGASGLAKGAKPDAVRAAVDRDALASGRLEARYARR
jgi:Raf kinase inhibitor-like YbhB/YbcL family protein